MSLHEYLHVEQGTEEWLALRCGLVTASTVGRLVSVSAPGAIHYSCPECKAPAGNACISLAKRKDGVLPATIKTAHPARVQAAEDGAPTAPPVLAVANNDTSRALTTQLVAERITGWSEPMYVSDDMIRGTFDEPVARDYYSEHHAPAVEVGFMVRDDWGYKIGYSPDGLVGDDGLIEIKSRRPKKQLTTILTDRVPAENMAQIQCGLLVSGRAWCDYVSYAAGMPLWTKRVYPDPRWHAVIIDAVAAFENVAARMVATYTKAVTGLPLTERTPDYAEVDLKL